MSRVAEAIVAGAIVAGRYRLDEVLGEGGHGIVWKAYQSELDRSVALKFLRRRDDSSRARFAREARVASALRHPGAVHILEVGTHEAHPFLAMEFVEGPTLRALLQQQRLTVERALDCAAQIADVLAAAHRIGLVHRDLTPSNVIVTSEEGRDRLRILDFGLAFLQDSAIEEGVLAGTPAYLSPEQAAARDIGPPSDLYALGCVLYELLTGSPPFQGDSIEVITQHLYTPPPRLRSARTLPAELDSLLAALLEKRPLDRPSARDAATHLASFRSGNSLPGRHGRMVPPAPPRREDPVPVEVAVVGSVRRDVFVALAANDVVAFAVTDEQPIGEPDAILAIGVSPEELRRLTTLAPVVAAAEPSDVPALRALIRAGASEVAPLPLRADDLLHRLRRALRRGPR
ncbi:MAG: serine/threonine-protein kinase [Myxococcota bacterium]